MPTGGRNESVPSGAFGSGGAKATITISHCGETSRKGNAAPPRNLEPVQYPINAWPLFGPVEEIGAAVGSVFVAALNLRFGHGRAGSDSASASGKLKLWAASAAFPVYQCNVATLAR